METPKRKEKKRRKAVWRECIWCRARGCEPAFRSGKLKTLEKHMVHCQAAHVLEQHNCERPKIDVIMNMVEQLLSKQAELSARLAVLEQRRNRPIDPTNYWNRLTPKLCWANRKENAVRYLTTVLSQYTGPTKYHSNIWDYFSWFCPPEILMQDILMVALWPVLEDRDGLVVLRGLETTDMYHLFKQVWGKSNTQGTDFEWYLDALEEIGVPKTSYDPFRIQQLAAEFSRSLRKFQVTKKRAGGVQLVQGLVPLARIWKRLLLYDGEILTECIRLPPREAMRWETAALLDQPPLVSEAARADSKSVSGPQSST